MKSERNANFEMASYAERTAYEREAWAKVLAAPEKRTDRNVKPAKMSFFSRFFKVA